MRLSRLLKLTLAVALVATVLPSSAFGQATRTWVSGVGDDQNPCSRTAPCKTLIGAFQKTAAGGQISGLDGGGFGTLSINKSITIDLRGLWEPGVLAAGAPSGITVNAGPNDRVTLRGLNINGGGSGQTGIRVVQARSVKITDSDIYGFTRNGILWEPTTNPGRLIVQDNLIRDNGGAGVMVAPPTGAGGRATLRRNEIDDNTCGIVATRFGHTTDFGTDCGSASSASGVTGNAVVQAFGNAITDNTANGILASGTTATVRMRNNDITGNTNGVLSLNSGVLQSFGGNVIAGNSGANGAPTSTLAPIR